MHRLKLEAWLALVFATPWLHCATDGLQPISSKWVADKQLFAPGERQCKDGER